jgi:hypothetical protein
MQAGSGATKLQRLVMAGLVPAISIIFAVNRDPRDISAFTRVFDALCPRVTTIAP